MRISRVKFAILLAMSVIGVAASSFVYYLYELLHTSLPVCTSSQKLFGFISINCNTVLSSSYNNVLGVNLDILAIVYFLVSISLVCVYAFASESISSLSFKVLFVWRFLGLLIVPYLMTVEFVILKTICVYCTIMHVCILVDFGVVTYFFFYKSDESLEAEKAEPVGAPALPPRQQALVPAA